MRPFARSWLVPLSAVILSALFVADLLTRDDTVLVALYALAPLIAALGGTPQAVAAVGVLALALAAATTIDDNMSTTAQDVIRLATVLLASAIAVWIVALRERMRGLNRTAGDELGFLTEVFERAPVGIALLDTDLRYVRVNDRIAEINGVSAEDHVGRRIAEVLPGLPPEVEADAAEVARTGRRVDQMEVIGSTPAQPGVTRHWMVTYWPVRTPLSDEVVGVGVVVGDVTERRAAERALRDQTDRYEALLLALSEAGEGLVMLERDGHCVYANHAFEQLSGYTFPELAAMDSMLELVAEGEREEARRRAAARMEQGWVQPGLAITMRRRDGAEVDLEVGGVPLEVEGRQQLVVVVRDVSERRRAETEREALLHRTTLLAEASELFDQSLDEQLTMASVARLCVRELADTCVVLLGSDVTRVRRVAVVARDEDRERDLTEALLRDPLEDRVEHPILTVLETGRSVAGAAAGGLGANHGLIVPLRARGRVHGVLAAGFDALRERELPELLALFEDLGRRAALALDNARLYEERDQVARTLQRSLLPASLPEIPGAEIAARYVAAGDGNEVGGDFYDCFATGAGDWALVIGDVCGKGAEAATLTALARYTLRAAAAHTRRPRAVLRELNEALLRQRLDYRFCTVLYVSLTPRVGHVDAVVATGGHPLPLVLRANGEVQTAGRPGTLLGILDDPELSEARLALRPGDALVLYTDGVTEATAADRANGSGRFEAFLASCAGGGADSIAEAVEREAVSSQGGPPRDDVAVVVARALGGPAASFDLTEQGVAAST
ncbi:MAG TPA: SpoIIE family protein phosphatase [Solirubrobacteraceae bacterium]|nr:SpoIIE family protein phosphatase [Solirubrobacteraceae bacterium]